VLSNIIIVFVEPQYPGNVGAAARSAYNYGIKTIRTVNSPIEVCDFEAKKMSLYGFELLQDAVDYKSLPEAIADASLVIGTVHQTRYHRSAPERLWELISLLKNRIAVEMTAIVFGREDNGLTREEINACHYLVTIPTPESMSFNLAHSVTVCLYEIFKATAPLSPKIKPQGPNQREYEEFFDLFYNALEAIDFFRGNVEESVMISIRELIYKTQPSKSDLGFMKAILYRILRFSK